ncbi:MAG: hypothetical protein J7J82_04090 [Staphylothermus sp.]|nr:hypothetical protein [Staphylothermus sp.]
MLKYFILLFFIPVVVVGLSMTVIFYYNPAITQSTMYGTSGPIIYSASTIAPNGRPVFIYVVDNVNNLINNYKGLGSETYSYYLRVENRVPISLFTQFDKIELLVIGSNTPIPSYHGSIDWNVASKVISFIKNNKYAEIPPGSSVEINLKNIHTAYTYTAVIVYVKKNTVLSDLSLRYRVSSYAYMPVTDAIREEMKGNYSVATVLSGYRRSVLYDIFEINSGVVISIVSRISLSEIMILRWIIAFTILLVLLIYDYKRNPENYELINKILRKIKRSKR